MNEVIVITPGKGGVGKTTTSANIGTGLTLLGMRVVLTDTDIGLRNLDMVIGLESRIIYNLMDIVGRNYRMGQALVRDKGYPSLYLLPSAQTKDESAVNPGRMIKLVNDLRDDFDYVLLDYPAGIEQGFRNATTGVDRTLVVTTLEVSAIRGANRVIGLLESTDIGQIGFIMNRIRMDMVKRSDMMSIDDVMDTLTIPMLSAISDNEATVVSTNQGEPLAGMPSPSGQTYLDICKRLLGEEIPLISPDISRGILSRLSLLLRQA